VIRCSKCGRENRQGRRFCAGCGTALELKCPQCGASNQPDENYCGQCGFTLIPGSGSAAEPQPAPAVRIVAENSEVQPLDGERKTVTALFADIKGSTELMAELDPEEARSIVDPALKLMIEAVHRYDGYIVQSTGDGIFALFGAPQAHEDHPQRALYAALRMQEDLRRYSARIVAEGGNPIQCRVGANTGEVVVRSIATGQGHAEYTPIGHTTNLASRMQAVAPVGSIATSDTTRRWCEGYFVFKSLGPTRLRGVPDPIEVYELTGLGPLRTRLQRAIGRGLTKFVGREREIDVLKHAAQQAQTGHGQAVAVMADPGVGKSRLFYEFKAISQSGWMMLEAFSVSHGKASAYLPVLDLLAEYFEISRDDDERRRRELILGKVLGLDRTLEDTLPYLHSLHAIADAADSLAGMDQQIRRRRTLEAIKRILLRESINQPLMLIFEDLHWIDSETQALLNLLVDAIANARILLLVNYRPEYRHEWGSRTHYTQLRLDPLGPENANEMLSALLGDEKDLIPLKRLIGERTQGTPFFIEEMAQALFEEGVLQRNGAVKLTRPLSTVKVPATVQGVLASRIDRLSALEKELLQTLAVIGMEFPRSLVREVVQRQPEQLDPLLYGLQAREFIYEQPRAADVEYTFKHALTHDVAYHSLLIERRKLIHERTAQAIEALYGEASEDHYADLAHHYRSSDNAAKAIEYLRLAGEQADRRGAYAQAIANIEPALRLIEQLPEGAERARAELGLRMVEGLSVNAVYGLASLERIQTFERVCELGERLGDTPALLRGLYEVGFAYSTRGEAFRAQEVAKRFLVLAEQSTSEEVPGFVYFLRAFFAYRSGDLPRAFSLERDLMDRLESAEQGATAESPGEAAWTSLRLSGGDQSVLVAAAFAQVEQAMGRPDQASKLSEQAVRRGRQLKKPYQLAIAIGQAGAVRFEQRDPEVARRHADAEIALAEEHGFRELLAWGRALRGWAMTELGQAQQGVAELDAVAAEVPAILTMPKSLIFAQAYLRIGRLGQAIATVDEALVEIERSGTHLGEPELYRLKGEGTLMRDSSMTAEAEAYFRRAIEVAQGQSAKWWELRATVSLARLLRDAHRLDEARTMLSDIYNWFTEGFDLPDLQEARALLDELSC
jgi:class 3 adenylate cyclase/tetratricopeptide (TPR) repeat protein